IVFYVVPMYWAGFLQASMLKEFTPEGQLKYQFLETVQQMRPFYIVRGIGGMLFLGGTVLMCYNLIKTIRRGKAVNDEPAQALPLAKQHVAEGKDHWHRWIARRPVQMMFWSLVVVIIGGAVEFIPPFLVKR